MRKRNIQIRRLLSIEQPRRTLQRPSETPNGTTYESRSSTSRVKVFTPKRSLLISVSWSASFAQPIIPFPDSLMLQFFPNLPLSYSHSLALAYCRSRPEERGCEREEVLRKNINEERGEGRDTKLRFYIHEASTTTSYSIST